MYNFLFKCRPIKKFFLKIRYLNQPKKKKILFNINELYTIYSEIYSLSLSLSSAKKRIDLQTRLQVFIVFRFGLHSSNYPCYPRVHSRVFLVGVKLQKMQKLSKQ